MTDSGNDLSPMCRVLLYCLDIRFPKSAAVPCMRLTVFIAVENHVCISVIVSILIFY